MLTVTARSIFATAFLLFVPSVHAQATDPTVSIRIVLIGDSTMSTFRKPPKDRPSLTGWGQVLGGLLSDSIDVRNHARSGRSSKSYLNEGHWKTAMEEGADFVFIQFGHNDEAEDPMRQTDPDSDFRDYLNGYIADSRAAGATPLLITPVASRNFKDGKVVRLRAAYTNAMLELAEQINVPVLDLNAASAKAIEELGEEGSADFFASETDRTHFSRRGALMIARLVVSELGNVLPELKPHLRAKTD